MNGPKFAVINGPNLNLLKFRDKTIYPNIELSDLNSLLVSHNLGKCTFSFFQSAIEGEIIEYINQISVDNSVKGLIINPAAYSHYSLGIVDALEIFKGPVVEVHLSNIYSRESIRQKSLTATQADVVVAGAGIDSYQLAVDYLIRRTKNV